MAEVQEVFLSPWPPDADCPAVRHLVERCSVCMERAVDLWAGCFAAVNAGAARTPTEPPSPEDRAFERLFDRVRGRVQRAQADFTTEKAEAVRLLPRLLSQPLKRQLLLATNSRRYQTWGVCELLLDEAWKARFKEPRRTEAFCQVAVAAAAGLPVQRYGAELTHDFQARCWIGLANGRRILADFRGAQAALIEAQRLLAAGTGNPLERAGWLDIRASLLIAQHKYREAEVCVGHALRIYAHLGEKHAVGRALMQRGLICRALEQIERAIVLTRTALELVEPDREPSLVLGGWLNLIRALHSAGRDRDALAALGQSRSLYLQSEDRTTVLRFQWLEGSIAASLGRDEQAEGCLREVREGFVRLGMAQDAALVSLDLAVMLCRQGRTAEMSQLALEMIAIFESREIKQDSLAAFILLRQAAERDRVTEALLQQLGARLREPQARV